MDLLRIGVLGATVMCVICLAKPAPRRPYNVEADYQEALHILREYRSARSVLPPFSTEHEGAAVIRQEFEELWEMVKGDSWSMKEMHDAATDIGAMSLAFAVECCPLGREED